VRERPTDVIDSDVAAALASQWSLTIRDLSYLPIGFGGYHWLAIDQAGSRWFVTLCDLSAPWLTDLSAAMESSGRLAGEAGLEFVVAPVPTSVGQVVGALGTRYALTLFPYLDGVPSRFGDPIDNGDRATLIDHLARLHTVDPTSIRIASRPLELASRETVDQALTSLAVPWSGGPYAEPGRALLIRRESPLRRALARFDALLEQLKKAGGAHVITHGEPHPGNLLRTTAGLRFVDWDMTALAHPERDLWWVISDDHDAARYTQRTGRHVDADAMEFYRLRWRLDDIADFLSEIRNPHEETADTLVSWKSLQETLESLANRPS
jgi:spectinomycin phosphotransferase